MAKKGHKNDKRIASAIKWFEQVEHQPKVAKSQKNTKDPKMVLWCKEWKEVKAYKYNTSSDCKEIIIPKQLFEKIALNCKRRERGTR